MSPVHSNTDFSWYLTLEEAKADNFSPVKCYSPLQFFELRGKSTVMSAGNIEPIAGLLYCYHADEKYYIKQSHGYTLQEFFFYAPYPKELNFSGDSQPIDILRKRIQAGMVWLLFNAEQVESMKSKLIALYKGHYKGEGKVPYNTYIKLMMENLNLEDYRRYGTELTGFKTVCRQYEVRIEELWKSTQK